MNNNVLNIVNSGIKAVLSIASFCNSIFKFYIC